MIRAMVTVMNIVFLIAIIIIILMDMRLKKPTKVQNWKYCCWGKTKSEEEFANIKSFQCVSLERKEIWTLTRTLNRRFDNIISSPLKINKYHPT